jgi:threonine dehydrogenase-like Zn-dependent dehydrogenase
MMKANCWFGKQDLRVVEVPDPKIENPKDAIVRITATAICGSDLHLYNGFMPTMEKGDVLGHEFMGEIIEVGHEVKKRKIGDRVVVAFPISCGHCFFCKREMFSLCDNSNPNAEVAEKMMGHSPAGVYGYSHMLGGFAGGQAEYARVPFADTDTVQITDGLADEQVLFLSDILPTAYMAVENCSLQPDETVAIWGCGPVGLLAIMCAKLFGVHRIISIDRIPERLALAEHCGATTINYEETDVQAALQEMTSGMGPDACIDAVGMEAHLPGIVGAYDRVKQAMMLETERPHVLRQAIMACRKGGTLSIPGVYVGHSDKIPFGALMNKALTVKTGQTHVQKYMTPLLNRIKQGEIDPSIIITHRMKLKDAPQGYELFGNKQDGCIKVVLSP